MDDADLNKAQDLLFDLQKEMIQTNNILIARGEKFIHAAAVLMLCDKQQYHGLYGRMKDKGVRVSDWEKDVKKVYYQLETERNNAQKAAAASAQAKAARPSRQWAPMPQGLPAQSPVDGSQLMVDLQDAIQKFVMITSSGAMIIALWILFTWLFEHIAETNPFLRIISPAKNCGKTTCMKVIKRLCRSGWLLVRVTASAFVRTMEKERRTLLNDEGDASLAENELMRNVLDGASDPDTANVAMSVKIGSDWVPSEFNCFCPICIASIGKLKRMETVESRGIAIWLKRATREERKKLTKARARMLKTVLEPLMLKCAKWAQDNASLVAQNSQPRMPEILDAREMDLWEPLVAIADVIGSGWGDLARAAAISASQSRSDDDDKSESVLLLSDLRQFFSDPETHLADPEIKRSSKELCDKLASLEDRPWAELEQGRGKGTKAITPNRLASLLKPFVIVPHTLRFEVNSDQALEYGETAKGYEGKDFRDAWDRYVDASSCEISPHNPDPNRHNDTTQLPVQQNPFFQNFTEASRDGSLNGTFPHGEKGRDGVTFQNAIMGTGTERERCPECDATTVHPDSDGIERCQSCGWLAPF